MIHSGEVSNQDLYIRLFEVYSEQNHSKPNQKNLTVPRAPSVFVVKTIRRRNTKQARDKPKQGVNVKQQKGSIRKLQLENIHQLHYTSKHNIISSKMDGIKKRKISDVESAISESSSQSPSYIGSSLGSDQSVDGDRMSESEPLSGQHRNYSVTFRLQEMYELLEEKWNEDNLNLAELENFSLQDFHMDDKPSTLGALDHDGT